jgi:thiosulfate reductase cytochrome b subunit
LTDTPTELPGTSPLGGRVLVRRHSLLVRITHWINVLCILVLIMSGAQIFNAHSALYIGQIANFDAPVFSMTAKNTPTGPVGDTQILGAHLNTTGFLGLSTTNGAYEARGFPWWFTIPSYRDLTTGRRWHFFFAWVFAINGLIYLIAAILSRHVWRDLIPTGAELRGVGRSIWDHMRLRFDHTRRYNVLQQLAYLSVIFLALPLIVLAGMTMSPGLDTAFPWLVDVFQGRQTARTIHFIVATAIVLFVFVHVVMVLISGVWNNIRSMITGNYAVSAKGDDHVS